MAEQSTFARRMMAQKLMAEKRDDPFSDSRFFAGKMRPSMDDIENPTRLSDMAGPAYGAAATGSLFAPGAGIADVMGYAPDPMQSGKMLPSFGENIGQGKYLDAGLQTLGVAGDVLQAGGAIVPPLLAVGTMLKAPRAARVASRIKVTNTADVSDTFGEGAKSVTYTDPDSGGFIEVVQRKDGPTSVLGLEVPEQFRGSGIGQELQAAAMADNPMLQGQVSSKAAAVGAYRLGRRPVGKPDATLDEVFGMIDDQSSVLMRRPDPNQAAGAAMDAARADPYDVAEAARLARAKEQGFDVDNPVYHGTSAEKLTEFDEKKIGSATDDGYFGKGIYFASNSGEAKYYGPNVGKYVVRGKFLDLNNKTGDYSLGGAKKFIGWATQLDEIGALDDFTKEGLEGAKKLVKYFDENVKFNPGQNPDGTTGVYAQIVDPTRKPQIYKGKEYPETVDLRVDARGFFAEDEAKAAEMLFYRFSDEMQKSYNKDIDYFKGWNDDFYTSLSDYVRVGPVGSAELSKKAKAAGFDGIKAADETVVFDPKNIRLLDAEFDPKKTDSPDLLSSRAVDQAIFA